MKVEKVEIKLAHTKWDGRVKITKEQKIEIKQLSAEGISQRKLAKMYEVSRWTIQNILSPTPRCQQKTYSAEYWRKAKQKYRNKVRNIKKKYYGSN